ncbi:MAG TPA: sigma-70 family RNA polymerase sigma factor [Egibacteraceae bacterium]|nr:sigma-70 family RNA polymerase sigma factor [Egibacteraceae bacterium]
MSADWREEASDEALVAAYVAGDANAFDRLVDRYDRRVYAICYRYLGDPADAEDAAQETFLALLRRAATFTGAASFSTWLYRVATNACHDLVRKRSRRPQRATADIEDLSDRVSVDDVLANRELRLELSRALATLDPDHRAAVVLHDMAGVGYAELAQRFGVPVGTVKSRIHRGHARLAAALGGLREQPAQPSSPVRPPTAQS